MNIPGFPGHVNGYCSLSYAVRHTTHPAHPSPRIAADWGGRAAAACGKPNTPTLPRRVCYTGNADLAAASIRLVCDMATRGGWQQLRLLSDWTAPVHTDKGRGDIIIRGVALLIPEGSELSGDGKDPQVVAGPRLSLGLRSHKCVYGGGVKKDAQQVVAGPRLGLGLCRSHMCGGWKGSQVVVGGPRLGLDLRSHM